MRDSNAKLPADHPDLTTYDRTSGAIHDLTRPDPVQPAPAEMQDEPVPDPVPEPVSEPGTGPEPVTEPEQIGRASWRERV